MFKATSFSQICPPQQVSEKRYPTQKQKLATRDAGPPVLKFHAHIVQLQSFATGKKLSGFFYDSSCAAKLLDVFLTANTYTVDAKWKHFGRKCQWQNWKYGLAIRKCFGYPLKFTNLLLSPFTSNPVINGLESILISVVSTNHGVLMFFFLLHINPSDN